MQDKIEHIIFHTERQIAKANRFYCSFTDCNYHFNRSDIRAVYKYSFRALFTFQSRHLITFQLANSISFCWKKKNVNRKQLSEVCVILENISLFISTSAFHEQDHSSGLILFWRDNELVRAKPQVWLSFFLVQIKRVIVEVQWWNQKLRIYTLSLVISLKILHLKYLFDLIDFLEKISFFNLAKATRSLCIRRDTKVVSTENNFILPLGNSLSIVQFLFSSPSANFHSVRFDFTFFFLHTHGTFNLLTRVENFAPTLNELLHKLTEWLGTARRGWRGQFSLVIDIKRKVYLLRLPW